MLMVDVGTEEPEEEDEGQFRGNIQAATKIY
jgi:hypothetical protein